MATKVMCISVNVDLFGEKGGEGREAKDTGSRGYPVTVNSHPTVKIKETDISYVDYFFYTCNDVWIDVL